VLDVGAGDGSLVDALIALGREAEGLERQQGRSGASGEDLLGLDGDWAAIVFWHSLEHLPEPAAALRRAARSLVPGGLVVIAVPNGDSLQARVFGARWFALDPPRHLVHLGSTALRDRLRALGLRNERVSYLRGGQVVFGWLDGMVGALPGHASLYDAIRRPSARFAALSPSRRAIALLAALLLLPVALAATAVEVLARRGGTVYIEARSA
jgi:SAM-dependent methyltransferase